MRRVLPLRSIRARLTVTFTLSIALLLVASDFALVGYTRHVAASRADRVLREGVNTVRAALSAEIDEADENRREGALHPAPLPGAGALHATRQALEDEQAVALIVDPGGRLLRSEPGGPGPLWPRRGDDGWRTLAAQIDDHAEAGAPSRRYTVVVGFPWRVEQAELRRQTALLSALSGLVVLAGALGAWVLVGWTLRPIDALARQAAAYSAPERLANRPRLTSDSPDAEVVRLVMTLNGLLDGIAASAESKGRFYAAASHELRTPLHVLAGMVELALSRPRAAHEYRESLVEVQAQADRLVSLVQALLLLNRVERGLPQGAPDTVDLPAMIQVHLRELKSAIGVRLLRVRTDFAEKPVALRAPRAHADILVRNLLDNAVRYTPPEGEIRVTLSRTGESVILEICNTVDSTATVRGGDLFEAFYRADTSRTAATGGNGLGLSICKALADANGWILHLQSAPKEIGAGARETGSGTASVRAIVEFRDSRAAG